MNLDCRHPKAGDDKRKQVSLLGQEKADARRGSRQDEITYHANAFDGAGVSRVWCVIGVPGDFACELGPSGLARHAFEARDTGFLATWT